MNAVAPPPTNLKVESSDHEKHDPLTGAPHYHPVASGTGAAAGGTLGAVIGSIGGPIGAAVGVAVGGFIGGLVGKSAAEGYDEAYWRTVYPTEPYFSPGSPFETYDPAYRYGMESWRLHEGRPFAEVEPTLAKEWHTWRGDSDLTWDEAKAAAERAYHHRGATLGEEDNENGVPSGPK